MNKEVIGKELKQLILEGRDLDVIANWAYRAFYDNYSQLSNELTQLLYKLSFMSMGPEFEYSKQKLLNLADQLIAEGKQEELAAPIVTVLDKALILEENWLMCPLCQEVWEDASTYAMVRCPKCNNKLHNPKFISQE